MLRDRIVAIVESTLDGIVVWLGLGMMAFIGWALSRHVDWEDALAITFGVMLVLRAVRKRGDA